uniref:NADH-ubiquinone oxidoreductase chain 4 n=1 Tax=Homidia sp. TaxID=3054010 RepID=A0AAU6PU86_9HEXA
MMKFLLLIFFLLLLFPLSKYYFWLVNNVLILTMMILLCSNFILTDYLILSSFCLVDMLSYSLIVLSIFISILMLFSSYGIFKDNNYLMNFILMILALCLILCLTFMSLNMLSFYFYFEISLIPTLLIILGWGYQPERLQAGVYFLFYTITASLPLLIVLIYSFKIYGGLDFILFSLSFNSGVSFYLFIFMVFAFLVKMPMFFVHLWLPKAHVEAPVSGSMILAGVLLKLGGYGFYRVLNLSMGGLVKYGSYMVGLSILGMLYVGYMCCRLNDLKALVAYSSVAHMGLVICGIFSASMWGFSGGLMMMISHGLVSSGLFCVVNMMYERSSSRSLYINKGLVLMFPSITLFIFLLMAANMAAPPTINLLSEIFLMVSILKFDLLMLLFFPLGSYLGAVFTIFVFSFSQHGKIYFSSYSYEMFFFRELHVLFLHIIPANALILKSSYFLDLI